MIAMERPARPTKPRSSSKTRVPSTTLSTVVTVVTAAGYSIFSKALKTAVKPLARLPGSRPTAKSTMAVMVSSARGRMS